MLTYELATEYLRYEDGLLFWKKAKRQGKMAGTVKKNIYVNVSFGNKLYKAHRVIWLMHYGKWPENEIDHINGVKHDNRIENLREATASQNAINRKLRADNTSGAKGVSWHKRHCKWQVRIGLLNKRVHLGYFESEIEALNAYQKASKTLHGDFAR